MNSKAKGEKTQAIILAELVKLDYKVLIPYGDNQRYDFVVEIDGKFIRIQCKTARILKNGTLSISVRSVQSNTKGHKSRNYKGEVDGFISYCYENNKCFIVPIDKTGKHSISLRLDKPAKVQKTMNWAKDYELVGGKVEKLAP